MARKTGVTVTILNTPIPNAYITGVIVNKEGVVRLINTEGVQSTLHEGTLAIYTHGGYVLRTPEEVSAMQTSVTVDLSEFVRVFGQRLETNFYLAYEWANSHAAFGKE